MAHPILHFSTILALATAIQLPFVYKWLNDSKSPSEVIIRYLAICYGAAFFAIIPNILGHMGLPDAFWTGWWMNIFIFHHFIDKIKRGGVLIGELLFIICFALHYALILFAILRLKNRRMYT